MPVHLSIPTEGVYVCVSGEAPDDGEQAHDAVQDSNAIAHMETMARRISRRTHTQQTDSPFEHFDVISCRLLVRSQVALDHTE